MAVLGINDSHDSGAAISSGGLIRSAVNEERFTKKKNDVGFPSNSIKYLKDLEEIDSIALAWIGGNALVSRFFPKHDQKRRLLWRHELEKPSRLRMHFDNFIYRLSQNQRPRALWRYIGTKQSIRITAKRLKSIDAELAKKKVHMVEHHTAHAASAYYTSGFKEALIITLDGAGDGLSGTISIGDKGSIKRLAEFPASASLGLFYGAATMACDMRFNEDEGKLMSLAAYSYPAKIEGLSEICFYDTSSKKFVSKKGTRNEFLLAEYMKDHFLSRNDRESFANAVQAHAEAQVLSLAKQWIAETGIHNVAVAGGFFSNVIVNMKLERLDGVENLFIFPNMGDAGLSAGAASYVDFIQNGKFSSEQIQSAYFGPEYQEEEIENAIKRAVSESPNLIEYERIADPAAFAADAVSDGEIVLWFQGRMEYGPRALGNRSVLSLPGSPENREKINLIIKRRPYYQPFASTILEEDANSILEDYRSPNRFMTSANFVKKEHWKNLEAASHIDHTTRPQILGDENTLYRQLLKRVKRNTGIGAVLNTSLNKHGKPIVMSPDDALWTLLNTGAEHLVIGNFSVKKKLPTSLR
ncbi:MAG: carbamoyltransferase C-terminal domain-containing protein [Candidatus Micrarchaeaceae archaeon]